MSSYAALTDVGLTRGHNEDEARAIELPGGGILLAVADGVGGAPGGDVASHEGIERMVAELLRLGPEAMGEAIAAANDHVVELQGTRPEWRIMATTLVGAVVVENQARVANLGDSRAYLLLGGELKQLTRDDSWVAQAVASGDLTEEQARLHPWRNVVTKGLGVQDGGAPTFYQATLEPGDALLLCTDGLFKMLSDDDIRRILLGADDAENAAAALVEAANAAGGMDNIGVALYRA